MSVAQLDCLELASFAAVAVRHKIATLAEIVGICESVSAANAAAAATLKHKKRRSIKSTQHLTGTNTIPCR